MILKSILHFNSPWILIRRNITKCALVILCILNICLIIKLRQIPPAFYIMQYNSKYTSDVSCYKIDIQNDLLSADGRNFSPPSKSIFFHETSCKGYLDSRQACSVESTIRAHPGWQINILFPGPVNTLSLRGGTLMKLSQFSNVKLRRIHVSEYAKGTLLEHMMSQNVFNGEYSIQHAGDVLKYLSLYKWGGVSLDLDVIVVKPFDSLKKNFAVRQDDDLINPAIISLGRNQLGRNISRLTLRELQDFRADVWYHNGPRVITAVLKEFCKTEDIQIMSADACNGFEVYDPKYFYPIHYSNWEIYFRPGDLTVRREQIYTHHIWNHLNKRGRVPKNSLYDNLAKLYCPMIYEMYGDEFGT